MEITFLELVQGYGFNSILIAVTVCILTGLIKMPIKNIAAKAKAPEKYTKYITFLPLILGFGITALYEYFIMKTVKISGDFITLWLTSSSLSLAIYAFIEKFIPSKKKILSIEEIRQNEELLNKIKDCLTTEVHDESQSDLENKATELVDDNYKIELNENQTKPNIPINNDSVTVREKIILKGRKND